MKIIFKNEDNSIGIITPSDEALSFATIEQIAEKDVPYNLPYWIVSDTDIPSDRTDRDRWVLENMPEPNGFGGTSNEFSDEQLLALYNAGAIT